MKNWFLTRLTDLREAVTVPGLSEDERLARARMLTEEQQAVATLAGVDPYGPGSNHTRIGDLLVRGEAALERQDLDRVLRELATVEIVPQPGTVAGPVPPYPLSQWLTRYAVTSTRLGPLDAVTGPLVKAELIDPLDPDAGKVWDGLPVGTIDPDTDLVAELAIAPPATGTERWSVYAVEASRQVALQTVDFTRAVEGFIACGVDRALESQLAEDLAGELTAVPLAEAEAAVAEAWSPGVDLVLCAPADRFKWIRAYTTGGVHPEDRPDVVPVYGIATGEAIALASASVHLEVTPIAYNTFEAVDTLAVTIGGYRYGRVLAANPGAVQKVTLPA